eukprot:GSChrysophyteH2.ASY1.ANO1.447.1 assembled CDS
MRKCFRTALLLLVGLLLPVLVFSSRQEAAIRTTAKRLFQEGDLRELLTYLQEVEGKYDGLDLKDGIIPTLYAYQGVALYNAKRMDEAATAFRAALNISTVDTRSWINLGEVEQVLFHTDAAIYAFEQAYRLGDSSATQHLLRAKGWVNDWQNFEQLAATVESTVRSCIASVYDAQLCQHVDSSTGYEYTYLSGDLQKFGYMRTPNAHASDYTVSHADRAHYWPCSLIQNFNKRLKVGIVSADFGVHPVATLARGLIQYINPEKIELYAFSLQPHMSWWGRNISRSVEHFIYLNQVNTKDMAAYVAAFDIEVLIDLNGHTQFSGLRFMAHRPAPFIDYYIGDAVALPPEHSSHFTESLVLVPGCYIVNDYAQLQGDIGTLANRAPRSIIKSDVDIIVGKTPFLMATLSNTQKLDPSIFHVWANILQRFPAAKMLHMNHVGSDAAMKHLRKELNYYGLNQDRFAMAEQAPWIEHLLMKSSIDLVLDSSVKNGHTTGLDGIFAGIPTMTFATGTTMSSRAGQSILTALGSEIGLAYSMRDYEDNASDDKPAPFPDSTRLSAWREHVRVQREVSSLFDTQKWAVNFERSMHDVWELAHLKSSRRKHYHIIAVEDKKQEKQKNKEKEKVSMHQVYTKESTYFDRQVAYSRRGAAAYFMDTAEEDSTAYAPLPVDIFDGRYIFLNIGGYTAKSGWYNVNSQAKDLEIGKNEVSMDVDITRLMHDLHGFPDKSVSAIYASHILEHAAFGDSTLFESLQEWYRVLRPGGLLMISVPDLTTLFQMYLRPGITLEEKWLLTRVIYGAQTDEYDYHKVGFSQDILQYFLENPFQGEEHKDKASNRRAFCNVDRVDSFQLFADSSEIEMQGHKISLNLAASRCVLDTDTPEEKSFKIEMNSIPYKSQQFPHNELCESCKNSQAETKAETEAEAETGTV